LEELEPIVPRRPLADGQTVNFKNLGSNEFMNDIGRIGLSRQFLTSSKEISTGFVLSEHSPKVFIVNCNDGINALDFSHTNPDKQVVSLYKKHSRCNQRWIFDKKPQGTIIRSPFNKLNLVLVQKDNMYTCVPWDDIEGTDLEKFAYWLIIN
jgi:hypothetical protein